MDGEYLLRKVKPEEFSELKRQEQDIINYIMQGFNVVGKPKVQGIKTTFKYNPKREIIGIYLNKEESQRLVVESDGLSDAEDAVVGKLYSTLEKRLDRLRLPKEEWVDSISQ